VALSRGPSAPAGLVALNFLDEAAGLLLSTTSFQMMNPARAQTFGEAGGLAEWRSTMAASPCLPSDRNAGPPFDSARPPRGFRRKLPGLARRRGLQVMALRGRAREGGEK
jgi:hypothetical protein